MKQQTCLVTGGAGFIGSHLVDFLLDKNFHVIAVDNLLTGSEQNLSQARDNARFSFIAADVSKDMAVNSPIEYIFHLASPASVIDYQKYPEETALVNSVGTRNMLMLAKEKHARFLFASTSEVYGDPKEHPQKETYWGNVNPNGIRSCYDESKRYGEMMTQLYYRLHSVDTRIIRIFNTYGPRMRVTDGRVISNFVNQAIKGEPITVYGDGVQTRSFCYVSDLVEGIWAVMTSDVLNGDVVNLGNTQEYTMIDLAKKIKVMTNSSSDIVHMRLPEDDPAVRKPDIAKVIRATGWKPRVTLDEGLKKTIAYYRQQ
jgi:dTDP-glucose 4,6-dehydratase